MMNTLRSRARWFGLFAVVVLTCTLGARWQDADDAAVRFATVHVFADSADDALSAWQLDIRATSGNVLIVGIEGGEHTAYDDPPYYDPRAIQGERVVLAAYSLAADLPAGRTRIATIHVMITGDDEPTFAAELVTAATVGGDVITPTIELSMGSAS